MKKRRLHPSAVSLSSRLAEKAEIQAIRASPTPIFFLTGDGGLFMNMRYDVKEKPYSL